MFKCDNFMKILVVFMQECCRKYNNIDKNDYENYHLKKNFFQMNKLMMCVYDALSC